MNLKNIIVLSTIIVILTIILIFISGCDTRKDYFKDINKAPELKIRRNGTTNYTVNLKDSMKLKNLFYTLDYSVIDEQKDLIPSLSSQINISSNVLDQVTKTIKLYPEQTGILKALFSVTDIYTITTDTIELTVFTNLQSVANFEVIKTGIHDPLEININAITSYDRDAAFGGSIINYEYKINSFTITSTDNNVNYILPQTGNYTIKVRVQDDDLVWSEYKTILFTMN